MGVAPYVDLTNKRPEGRTLRIVLVLLRLILPTAECIHKTRTLFGFRLLLVLLLLVLLVAPLLVFRVDVLSNLVGESLGVFGDNLLGSA